LGFIACVVVGLGGAGRGVADTAVIPAAKDNTLFEDPAGALSNGAGEYLYVGKTGPSAGFRLRRGLVAFDVAGAVPSGATITSATLSMTLANPSAQPATTVAIHKVSADWGEGSSDSGDPGGAGAASTPGDATWVHRFFNTLNWTTLGGDFVAGATASQSVSANGPYTWASNPTLVADVQGWLDNPATNFGWMIRGNETTNASAVRFASRDNLIAGNRPVLTVEYTAPPAPAVSLTGMAALAIGLAVVAGVVLWRRGHSNAEYA
jgi:hypothetical protein